MIPFGPGYRAPEPNVYVTDFSEYTLGQPPSDWTPRRDGGYVLSIENVPGSLSGKALRYDKQQAGTRHFTTWDRVPVAADVEVLWRARAIQGHSVQGNFLANACVRVSGSISAYMSSIYVNSVIGWGYTMNAAVDGSGIVLDDSFIGPPGYEINRWYWARFRVNGSTLQIKVWWHGTSEPSSWFRTISNTLVSAPGLTGIFSGAADPDLEIDFFSVGINGASAPSQRV